MGGFRAEGFRFGGFRIWRLRAYRVQEFGASGFTGALGFRRRVQGSFCSRLFRAGWLGFRGPQVFWRESFYSGMERGLSPKPQTQSPTRGMKIMAWLCGLGTALIYGPESRSPNQM